MLLHPYDCRSVKEGWICDNKLCHAWHDRWEFKERGTPINPYGAWNGGSFQTPPKGFEKAPGIKEKGEKKNEKEESNKDKSSGGEGNLKGALEKRGPSLKEKVDMNAEALVMVSKNIEHLTQLHSQNQWSSQWGGPDQYKSWGGGYW